jgi:hypothetical protein
MTNAIITQTQTTINAGDYAIVDRGTNDERLVTMWLQSGKRGNSPLTQGQLSAHVAPVLRVRR